MRGFVVAVAFMTRIPIPVRVDPDKDPGAAVPWFPVVGAGVGALVGGVAWAGLEFGLPPLVAAGAAIAASLLLTGALHEDGLADTFDGLGSGRAGAAAIEVMRDSRIGAFGAAALTMTLLMQVGTMASIATGDLIEIAVAAHAASRALAVGAMLLLPAAASDGLGAAYARTAGPLRPAFGIVVGLGIAGAILRTETWIILPAIVTGAAIAWWAWRRIGGITGDVLGAVQQVTLVTILVGAASLG